MGRAVGSEVGPEVGPAVGPAVGPDSDVIAYVPKDYCGPCVGGYHSSTSRN